MSLKSCCSVSGHQVLAVHKEKDVILQYVSLIPPGFVHCYETCMSPSCFLPADVTGSNSSRNIPKPAQIRDNVLSLA